MPVLMPTTLMPATLGKVAAILQVSVDAVDTPFRRINTDSRTVQPGELFVALIGENFDGHDYVEAAFRQGAVAAVVSQAVDGVGPVIRVADTLVALGQVAAAIRAKFTGRVIGVTGSNGKTTVKEMLKAILSQRESVLATQGNLNNEIGLPLTLMDLANTHGFAVLEMGANHSGEIEYLSSIGQPNIGIITNVGAAHLAGFGSLAGVARAKGEMFQSLSTTETAIINLDDSFAPLWQDMAQSCQQIGFGMSKDAAVYAEQLRVNDQGSEFELYAPQGQVSVKLPLLGQHNVSNALAASAAALAAGATLQEVTQGLAQCLPAPGRLNIKRGMANSCILDDTYNANPNSLQAGLEALTSFAGKHILVLGDMLELGDAADQLHEQAGQLAKSLAVNRLYCVGQHSRYAINGFGGGRHYADHAALLVDLKAEVTAGDVVLIKGSRGMHMEAIVNGLCQGVE